MKFVAADARANREYIYTLARNQRITIVSSLGVILRIANSSLFRENANG